MVHGEYGTAIGALGLPLYNFYIEIGTVKDRVLFNDRKGKPERFYFNATQFPDLEADAGDHGGRVFRGRVLRYGKDRLRNG